jgi:hypothetical protein
VTTDDKLTRLLNSALAVDAMTAPVFRRVTKTRRAIFVSTGGKTKEQIVADMARAMRRAGLLKPR